MSPRIIDKRLPLSAAKMTEETKIDSAYDEGPGNYFFKTAVLTENKDSIFIVRGYNWLLKYTVCRESDSVLVKVSVDCLSRYSFLDKPELDVAVEAADKKITEMFDLEKDIDQCFAVDLTKNRFSDVENKDIKVTCTVKVTDVKYTAEYHGTWSVFTSSKRPHDVVLIIGEKKFYVLKTYLAVWSRYFNTMFYGNFAEKDKNEVNIEDVDPIEFETLLKIIYPDMGTRICDLNVLYLLKLADRFDMPSVMSMCGTHLMNFENCPSLSLMERLKLSDQYNLSHLQVTCLHAIHKRPAPQLQSFMDENRRKIRKLSTNTVQNLV